MTRRIAEAWTSTPGRLLTVRDVAELDSCSEKTVRRAIKGGLLQTIRIGPGGRSIRISSDAHAAYRARTRVMTVHVRSNRRAEDPSGNHASGKGITVRTRVFPLGRASSLMAAGGPS